MYEYLRGVPEVKINLSNGIFVFQNEAAVGKSFLAERLHLLRSVGEPVDSVSFDDVKKFGDIVKPLSGVDFTLPQLKVVLFDRYDQYSGRFTDVVQSLEKSCIVLIDCKRLTHLNNVNRCNIRYNKTTIEVTLSAVHL